MGTSNKEYTFTYTRLKVTVPMTLDMNGHGEAAGSSVKAGHSILGRGEPAGTFNLSTTTKRRANLRQITEDGNEGSSTDFDEDNKMPSKVAIAVLMLHCFIIAVSFNIIIPTSRQYAESLGASDGFSGLTVGVVGFAAALAIPLYRYLVRRSYAGCLYFLVAMMQIGGVMYSLAQLAKTMWVMLAGRIFTGIGGGYYPLAQYVAEYVGKNHRSNVQSLLGIARSFGLAMGPILAAILVYVDFDIGELQIIKETNAGWTVALLCTVHGILIFWYFPKHGSQMLRNKAKSSSSPEDANNNTTLIPLKERILYYCVIVNTVFQFLESMIFVPAWEVAATKVVQTIFKWNIQNSALLVGGFIFTTGLTLYVSGKLSYRYDDRKILIISNIVNLCSIVLMFEYGKPMSIIPYLIGSFLFVNSTNIICIFSLSMSSKVTAAKRVESMQAYTTLIGLIARGVGAIIGDLLRPNFLAMVFMGLSVTSLLSTLLLY